MNHQQLWNLSWKPQRVYHSRLEAWPTHYPEWWEAPQRQRPGARFPRWLPIGLAFLAGLAVGVYFT